MQYVKKIGTFLLWFLFCITFTSEFVKIIFELSPDIGHKSLGLANAFFWSCLFLIELIMGALLLVFAVRHPSRRKRLGVLAVCHFTVIMVLPVALDDWSWTCLLYPWPHSLQALDPGTPAPAMLLSLLIGFVAVPLMTWRWGPKAFCGYVCPHGAFFSETYGRLFTAHPTRLARLRRFLPQSYFVLMTAGLLAVIFLPETVTPIRSVQKLVYFFTAEFFFFVIGIPLLGGRSYCTLICPMGYCVNLLNRVIRTGSSTAAQRKPAP